MISTKLDSCKLIWVLIPVLMENAVIINKKKVQLKQEDCPFVTDTVAVITIASYESESQIWVERRPFTEILWTVSFMFLFTHMV